MSDTPDDPRQAIRSLTASKASKAKRVHAMMPDIEAKMAEGVRQEEILEALAKVGIELDIQTFRNYLYRYRKKQKKQGGVKPRGPQLPREKQAPGLSEAAKPAEDANGNSQQPEEQDENAHDESPSPVPGEGGKKQSLEEILDAQRRGEYGYENLTPRKSLIKKRSRD